MLIKNITHSDMDGVGCSILISHLFTEYLGVGEVEVTKTSYGDLQQLISNIVSVETEDIVLVITDLRIETPFLKQLLNIPNIKKLLYIDHHERFDDRKGLESLKYFNKNRFDYRWRKEYSATKATYEYVKELGVQQTQKLDKLINVVDVYDMWRSDDHAFSEGMGLNEIFWEWGFKEFYDKMYFGLTWTQEMKEFVTNQFKEQDIYFENNQDYITEIELDNKITLLISFNPKGKFNNLYSLRYNADCYLLYDYENASHKKFSLRSNGSVDCNYVAREISKFFPTAKGAGHKNASGLTIPMDSNLELVINELINIIEKS